MPVFLAALCLAAATDLKSRTISRGFLLIFMLLGIRWRLFSKRPFSETLLAMLPGAVLLLFSRITAGEIGEGDGWFFVVSGLFLSWREAAVLFLSGLMLCGGYGLCVLAAGAAGGKDMRKKRLPFLPFLLPGGIWLFFS